jgi:predicted GNAT superfamily acetyltransferase
MGFSIRDLKTYEEMLAVSQLQRTIWGLQDPMFALYPPLLNTISKNGGVVLGAFSDESDELIAFLVGFLGREAKGPLKLCSQAMGVLPEWRRQGVGEALKQAQRDRAISQELPLITWTFDPLEAPNAYLNLHKLRAISRTYWRNVYGTNFGKLNAGLPTDRLLVEWWVRGDRVLQNLKVDLAEAASVFEVVGRGYERRIVGMNYDLVTDVLLLESVPDIHGLKAANMDLAYDWRLKIRGAFENYFGRGYVAVDFRTDVDPGTGQRQNRYILQKLAPTLRNYIGIWP